MDPSAMDFTMHAPEHGAHPSTSNLDHAARSACPALRAAAENGQPSHMLPRHNYPFDPVHNNFAFWQLPPPYHHPHTHRWPVEGHSSQFPPHIVPLGPGQISQPHYTPSGPTTYNPHQSALRNRAPMPSLQRIGGTAPIQHTQGNPSTSNQGQAQGGTASGTGTGGAAHGARANNLLPSINTVPPPAASSSQNLPQQTFPQTTRPSQQSINHSPPPPFIPRDSGVPLSSTMAETSSSSGARNEASSSSSASSSPPRRWPPASRAAENPGESASDPRRTNANRNRRVIHRLPSYDDTWSSDEESDPEAITLGLLEAADAAGAAMYIGPLVGAADEDDRMRAQQLVRGAVSGKRVASKKAITSLESVTISSLPENERTCVICYNDYGVQTPEGASETPLRLPKCKHVFGDHCIKKWFQESDSCPYCRDKVPSEPHRTAMNAHNVYRFIRQQQQVLQMRHGRDHESGRSEGGMPGIQSHFASNPFPDIDYNGPGGAGISRRMDYSRNMGWHPAGERHSPLPFNDIGESRRRTRLRHGSLRGFPQARQQHFGAPAPNNSSQAQQQQQQQQQYPWVGRTNPTHSHGRQNSLSSPTPSNRPTFDAGVPFPFHPHIAGPPEPYANPLNMNNSTGGSEEYNHLALHPHLRDFAAPLSPTFAGPEVYMSNADESLYPGMIPHQL
ncbi:uncharacterized protein F4822DRAFT_308426 [Hypoxylon trugodes]|uniref:uncharacterized protein n=1 Tax=Hypoxylon trugodes TaxID=326681 RepID=UPI002191AB27|nr:uncharacterized protein F4822DRAFT_308426 [Hypoxylon trugodes]KAI1386197.1 hypothetical protein F4822DRAFT_308426 [Hypoxylon trugodes]